MILVPESHIDFMCRLLNDMFDPPCSYRMGDGIDICDLMIEANEPDWCENNCDEGMKDGRCWKRFFEIMRSLEGDAEG